ncbi:SDR family NAD(P)-dependent oxidoreductase [Stackebrandtia soli]|uniref:SDR family NAD(P)-dependent oxidoreductase n=1 Tax=Stackebrandtia soli TaxID=1892856 RepID=UPI0039EBA715
MRITGNTVLITGASMGIGAATAAEFAKHGAKVLLVARSADKLDAVARAIVDAGGAASAHPADISTVNGVAAVLDEIRRDHGTPDVLVNNAGAGRFRFIEETDMTEFAEMAALPYLAAGYFTTGLIPDMLRRGSGHIVNVNSPVSRVVWPSAAGYAASRWALRGLTEALRADLRGTGVRVTEVIPGEVASQYFVNNPGSTERLPKIAKLLPRLTPEQVATRLVRAVATNRKEVIFPMLLRALTTTARLAPGIVNGVVRAGGARRA